MKKLYVIAGEPSGDYLGAKVISQINSLSRVKILGVGGELMQQAGLSSIVDIQQISIGGILEIVPKLFKIKRLINLVVSDILRTNPDVLLTIDSPGFCFRIAKLVRKRNPKIKLIHLVAPSVWAWRKNRAKKLAKLYDHLLTLFDFEPSYFLKYGLKTTFVGHVAIEEFKENNSPKQDILLILPGSRKQEIQMLLPIFMQSLKYLNFERVVIPTLTHLEKLIKETTKDMNVEIISDEKQKVELFRCSKCAIVASGTATLQLALSGCPMVCCYRLSSLSYHIIKSIIKIKYISLVNILLNQPVIPELIQDECNAINIATAIKNLDLNEQISKFKDIRKHLRSEIVAPSQKIAEIILSTLG